MQFKRGVVESLERELRICDVALANIKEKLEKFETRFTMSTEELNGKFEKGQLGDDEDFFLNGMPTKNIMTTGRTGRELLRRFCRDPRAFCFLRTYYSTISPCRLLYYICCHGFIF